MRRTEGRLLPRRRHESRKKNDTARESPSTVMERKRKSSGRDVNSGSSTAEDGPAKREKTAPCVQYTDVTAASFRIRKGVKETPLKVL